MLMIAQDSDDLVAARDGESLSEAAAQGAGRPAKAAEPGPKRADAPTARRDFGLLWAGQSTSLLGDQFMVLALPLLAVTGLGASASQAALLPFALFVPFLVLGLPAGAIVDRLPRRRTMLVCDAVQAVAFLAIGGLTVTGGLSFPVLLLLVFVAGCATVFFQVAYTSYLPALFSDPRDLHRGNTRLFLSESLSRSFGPALAGLVIRFVGAASAVVLNAATFVVSVLFLLAIKHRDVAPTPATKRERGWLGRDMRAGLRFVFGHAELEPVILCGAVYVLFLSMIEASLVLYCRDVLGLGPIGIGIVVGASAAGYPVGNLLSNRLVERLGIPRTLVVGAAVSVTGIVLMPLAGSAGSTIGLVAGSVVHCVGEGAFGPTSLTLRQTATPEGLLARVNSVQRFLIWGMVPLGSLFASLTITGVGLSGAMWVGALGTVLCLPVLVRRGLRAALHRGASGAAPLAEGGPHRSDTHDVNR